MIKIIKTYKGNQEIDLSNLNKRRKKSQSIIQRKNIINNNDIKKLNENNIEI